MKAVIRQDSGSNYPDISVFSGEEDFAPHILTFGIKGVRGEVMVHAFEDYDIFISTTSACSSKAGKPAGTLIAMGVEKDKAQSAVRLSLDLENDMSQVEQFLTKFKLIYNQTTKSKIGGLHATYSEIMIRYGELSTKGKNRMRFINKLRNNISDVLSIYPQVKVTADRDRAHAYLNGADYEPVAESLKQVFGIQNFSPVYKVEKSVEVLKVCCPRDYERHLQGRHDL